MRRRGLVSAAASAAALGVAAGLVVPATGSQPAPAAGCAQPHPPLYGATADGGGQVVRQLWPSYPVDAPDTAGTDLDLVRPAFLAGPDTDGDGRGDQVTIDLGSGEQVMVITRGDGVVRVAQPGANLGDLTSRPVGDLDGDGRDEVMFLARPASGGDDRIFVLPGTTPVGSHRADAVAVEIPTYFLYGAGDQLDGPGDDLVVTVTDGESGGSGLVSGADVLAPGPGGSLDRFPVARPLDGYPGGVFDLGDARPAVATVENEGSHVVVRLVRDGKVTAFATAGIDLGANTFLAVTMSRVGDRTYLRAGTGDRGGSTTFLWDVGDPCRVLPAGAAGGDPASPAAPVPGEATYTG